MTAPSAKSDKNRPQIFHEAVERLCVLLLDHPHFQRQIAGTRRALRLKKVLPDAGDALLWASLPKRRLAIRVAVDRIIGDFKIPEPLRDAVYFFVEDHILMGSTTPKHIFDRATRIFHPSGNIMRDGELANAFGVLTWVGIGPDTTERDLRDIWHRVAPKNPPAKKFGIPTCTAAERDAWLLKQQGGMTSKKIALEFRTKYPGKAYTYANVNVLATRYREALSALRPLN